MSQIVYQLTPMVIGLLLSPIPIAALIIMLMTARAQSNGLSFIAGWLLGIFGVGLIVIIFPEIGSGDSSPSAYAGLIRISLGLILISWALYKAYTRYHTSNPETPRFFQKLDHINPIKAFGIGLLVSAGNIKNLGFSAAAAVIVNQTQLLLIDRMAYLLSYTIFGSITVITPMILYLFFHHKADTLLLVWKEWLIKHHTYLLSVVVIFVGLMIITGGH